MRYAAALLIMAAVSFQQVANAASPCFMEVELTDGSVVLGTAVSGELSFRNEFARFRMDIKKIQEIKVGGDAAHVVLTLHNGDLLTVSPEFQSVAIDTIIGRIDAKLVHVLAIDISPTATPGKGLRAEYHFSGDAKDSSGNRGHGKVHGAVLTQDRFGRDNEAYAFNGERQWIEVQNSVLSNALDGLTISVWVKPDDLTGKHKAVITKQPSGYCSSHPSPTTSNHGGLFDMQIKRKGLFATNGSPLAEASHIRTAQNRSSQGF